MISNVKTRAKSLFLSDDKLNYQNNIIYYYDAMFGIIMVISYLHKVIYYPAHRKSFKLI